MISLIMLNYVMVNLGLLFKNIFYGSQASHPQNYIPKRGPQGLWGSGENGYLFSGSWGALVIILGEVGSKLIILGI